jgi:hypothetical protein
LLFQRINRSDAERAYIITNNVVGSTESSGIAVVWDITASVDGIRQSQPATATLSLLVGATAETISNSSYGKCQVYGLNTAVYVTNDTSQAIAAGDILIPVNAQNYFARSAASDGKTGFCYAAQAFATATTPAAATGKVFLRCL